MVVLKLTNPSVGYVVYHSASIASSQTILGQAWKEYSLSDSRYLTQDSFVITMEAITTVFWGPLCLAVASCIVANHPLRYPLQTIVSLGQIYGDVLYYATCGFEHLVWGVVYCRPEGYYFWAYFITMNAFWIIIPTLLLAQGVGETKRAFERLQELDGVKKSE
jgi:cholestenol Delta-isomerase